MGFNLIYGNPISYFWEGSLFGKMWKNMKKQPFFLAATAGLGKYCTGGYGQSTGIIMLS